MKIIEKFLKENSQAVASVPSKAYAEPMPGYSMRIDPYRKETPGYYKQFWSDMKQRQDIADTIKDEAKKQGIDPNYMLALAYNESRLDPGARSKVGAQGVFQFMPKTAKWLGIKNPSDVRQATRGAAKYIKKLTSYYTKKGYSPQEAFKYAQQAYNVGPTNVNKYLAGKRELPKETQEYTSKISRFWSSILSGGKRPGHVTKQMHAAKQHPTKVAKATRPSEKHPKKQT